MKIGDRIIGDGEPAFLLAEVASAHQGEAAAAIELARQAKDAGADGVKFQLFRADQLVAPGDSNRAVFDQIELSLDEWERVLRGAGELGIPVFADVFDEDSLALGERFGVSAYKIHSTDMENPDLLRRVAASGRPVLLSTGGATLGVTERALSTCRAEGAVELMLLYGVQNFPTDPADSNLRTIETLKRTFGLPVGFLDHVDGGSTLSLLLPALAVSYGACLVEKHITLDRSAKGFDYESALEQAELASLVELIRQAESAFGESEWKHSPGAKRYHDAMRRSVLSRVELPKGQPVAREHLVFLRSPKGIAPSAAGRLIGRKPRADVLAWTPLTEDLFD